MTGAATSALSQDEAFARIRLLRSPNIGPVSYAMLLQRFGSAVKALEALPGVGRKTANVVLNTAFGEPTMAVDTHIFRVANRTGMAPGKDPYEVELNLLRVTPEEFALGAHHWLILHGRYTCVARKPKCYNCAISGICKFTPKTEAP